jgi:capsid portal protein
LALILLADLLTIFIQIAVLVNVAGKDATKQFDQFHKGDILTKYGPPLLIGEIGAAQETKQASTATGRTFGDMVPYGDPNWYQNWHSAYYNESHKKFRAAVRAFVDKEITPFCHEWDENKKMPQDIYRRLYEAGILPGTVGMVPCKSRIRCVYQLNLTLTFIP